MSYPYLYSLQHCPYAMRARLGLLLAQQKVLVRAVNLKDKPAEMLVASPKGTVPILVQVEEQDGNSVETVLDESLEIMLWGLTKSDPLNLLYAGSSGALAKIMGLIQRNDQEFIGLLEKYKAASRYHDFSKLYYRGQCEIFIGELESRLQHQDFFMGTTASLADYALLPFIRQFARVDRKWYLQTPYPRLRDWLNRHLQQPLFTKAMIKYPLWLDNSGEFLLGSPAK